jgi:hypothetical protein
LKRINIVLKITDWVGGEDLHKSLTRTEMIDWKLSYRVPDLNKSNIT